MTILKRLLDPPDFYKSPLLPPLLLQRPPLLLPGFSPPPSALLVLLYLNQGNLQGGVTSVLQWFEMSTTPPSPLMFGQADPPPDDEILQCKKPPSPNDILLNCAPPDDEILQCKKPPFPK